MNNVFQAALELQEICQSNHWKFCFIGGLALQRWGEPRETVDVDLSLFAGFGNEPEFIEVLLKHFEARIPDAALFAHDRRVYCCSPGKVSDWMSLEELMIERSTFFEYPTNILLRTCSAEDLIVLKAFAARGQDWVDIERVIVRQVGKLDWNYIREKLEPLAELKDSPSILNELELRRIEFEQ